MHYRWAQTICQSANSYHACRNSSNFLTRSKKNQFCFARAKKSFARVNFFFARAKFCISPIFLLPGSILCCNLSLFHMLNKSFDHSGLVRTFSADPCCFEIYHYIHHGENDHAIFPVLSYRRAHRDKSLNNDRCSCRNYIQKVYQFHQVGLSLLHHENGCMERMAGNYPDHDSWNQV